MSTSGIHSPPFSDVDSILRYERTKSVGKVSPSEISWTLVSFQALKVHYMKTFLFRVTSDDHIFKTRNQTLTQSLASAIPPAVMAYVASFSAKSGLKKEIVKKERPTN